MAIRAKSRNLMDESLQFLFSALAEALLSETDRATDTPVESELIPEPELVLNIRGDQLTV